MERRAIILALALTLPLALYGVPYAYAVTTSSTYLVHDSAAATTSTLVVRVHCTTGDYATGSGVEAAGAAVVAVRFSELTVSSQSVGNPMHGSEPGTRRLERTWECLSMLGLSVKHLSLWQESASLSSAPST